MSAKSHTTVGKSSALFLALAVGLVTWLATSGSGLAVPKQSKSCDATGKDKGMNACADSPGHIIVCTSGGDYLCCKITPTGRDCEEIVKDDEASVMGTLIRSGIPLLPGPAKQLHAFVLNEKDSGPPGQAILSSNCQAEIKYRITRNLMTFDQF